MPLRFLVQGSQPEPYNVTFTKEGDNLTAKCDCSAAVNGLYCKHRFNILAGDVTAIVSGNESDVGTVCTWLAGTDVETAMIRVQELEVESAKVKKQLADAKKAVARSMMD